MSWLKPTDTDHDLIDQVGKWNPALYRLALVLGPALRIEPLLLRNARLRFLPQSDAGLESQLWFSFLIGSRSARAVSLRTGVARLLTDRLETTDTPFAFAEVWRFIETQTGHWPAEERLEQRLRQSARRGDKIELGHGLRAALRLIIGTSSDTERRDLARWLKGAIPALNGEEGGPEELDLAAQFIAATLGDPGGTLGRRIATGEGLPHWLRTQVPTGKGNRLGLRLWPGVLEILAPEDSDLGIDSDAASPAPVHIRCERPTKSSGGWEPFWPGRRIEIPRDCTGLILTTLKGTRYRLAAAPENTPDYRGQYRYHAFISYAWADDQSSDTDGPADQGGDNRGWVSTFRDRYRKHLGRTIGSIPEGERIWLDYEQLRGNHVVNLRTLDALKDSALLIPILSKAWFASNWCRQEFTTFIEYHPDWQKRLFPVWMDQVKRDEIDEEDGRQIWDRLRERLDYQFWYKDKANRIHTRWFPNIDPTDREYSHIQQKMARDMAEWLKLFTRVVPSPEPTTLPQSQSPTPCNPPVPPIEGDHFVMITGGSGDTSLVQQIARVLDTCEGLDYAVPLMAQGRGDDYEPSGLLHDLRENLKLATAVLMVVDKGPPDQINEQLREYRQAAAKRPDRPSLDVCHLGDQPLGFHVPDMRVHRVTDSDIVDCACNFARELQA